MVCNTKKCCVRGLCTSFGMLTNGNTKFWAVPVFPSVGEDREAPNMKTEANKVPEALCCLFRSNCRWWIEPPKSEIYSVMYVVCDPFYTPVRYI